MFTDKEFNLWSTKLRLSSETRKFINSIRCSEPVRLARGGSNSVAGLYPSRLMGRTLQFESHHCELSFIQQMEHAKGEIFEIWDQPIKLSLTYKNKNGKHITVQYVPDFLLCRKEYAELVECKTEEDLIKLAEEQPNRYCRGENGIWQSPPMEECAKKLGIRFSIYSTSNINSVYIRNLDFLDDYMRAESLLIAADSQQFILSVIKEYRGISLAELLDYILGQDEVKVESDDIYYLILRGDIYVNLYSVPLAVRERVQVFENYELAKAYAPLDAVPSAPRAKYVEFIEGTRLIWDNKVWKIGNIGQEKVWLLGEATDAAFTHQRFEEYVSSGVIELLDPAPELDPYRQGLETLNSAAPHVRAEAERRLELIKPYLNKEKSLCGVKRERSLRRYVAAFKEAQAYCGIGLAGLLPEWYADGKSVKRLSEKVYLIMDNRIANDYETTVQKNISVVYGSVLNDCEEQKISEDKWPSYVTFCKRVNSRPRAEQTKQRKGNKAAYQHETHIYWIEKDTPPHGDRPFQIAHADCTQLDVELVCPITGENMGRPWAAFLIDAYTRLLLAMFVTFDEPSYRTTMMLLRECARRHRRLPQTIMVDRGKEFDNIYLRRLAGTFEITVKFRPPSKPRHGSVSERLFGIANGDFVHNLEGNTQIMTEIRKLTKSINPKTQASWPLGPFTEWFTIWGYEIYNKRPHWTLEQRPIEAFARALELTGKQRRLITYDETFRILTMPTTRKKTAKNVVDKGVKINNIYYWNEALRERSLEGKQLHVRYDPFNVSISYIWIRGRWVRCTAEYYATFDYCTERQLKIASQELRKRHKKFLRARPLTAKALADFIRRAEEVQKGQAELRLLNQRVKDREVRPIFTIIDGGVVAHTVHQTGIGHTLIPVSGSDGKAPDPSPFSAINFEKLRKLKELK